MILDELHNANRYAAMHPGLAPGFALLHRDDLASLDVGRYPIDGERLVLIIGRSSGLGREGARLEAHRRYMDIQFSISGDEEIGWRAIRDCHEVFRPYNEHDDELFADLSQCWLALPPGKFAVFFPEDAHAPLAGKGPLHKAVVKVAVDW